MHHCHRFAQLLFIAAFGFGTAALAQADAPAAAPAAAEPAAPAAPEPSGGPAAAASETPSTPATGETAAAPEEPVAAATPAAGKMVEQGRFGAAARWRWVTVPGWFLGLFTQKNVPLSTFNAWGLEGFWRKRDKDDAHRTWEIVVSVGYQNMSVSDGYWLGKGKNADLDTDLVQTKNLGLITMDAAYVLRQYFSPYFGIHYGAGLGLGVVRGKVLRTSARQTAPGQFQVISADGTLICDANAKCNEILLAQSQLAGQDRGPTDPHRFEESSVPGALPILNLLVGLDFPIPDAKGLEFRLEGGFYDAFFIGLSGGYVF
jgi:hypothetical protein